MRNKLQRYFINWIIKDLFNTVDEDDIIRVVNGNMYFRGKLLKQEEAQAIKEDAERFKNSKIWYFLRKELLYHANQSIVVKSKTLDDILAGKVLIFLEKIVSDKVRTLSKLK